MRSKYYFSKSEYCLVIILHYYSEDLPINTLLKSHRVHKLPIENDQNYQRVVRRKFIFKDTVHHLKNYFIPQKYLRVTFSTEQAVDNGGPLREFFYLLLQDISIFCGPDESRCIMHSMVELDKKTYYYAGLIIALSLIYGGPAPKFFCSSIAEYIACGNLAFGNAFSPSFLDIPDTSIKEKLCKVCDHYAGFHTGGVEALEYSPPNRVSPPRKKHF